MRTPQHIKTVYRELQKYLSEKHRMGLVHCEVCGYREFKERSSFYLASYYKTYIEIILPEMMRTLGYTTTHTPTKRFLLFVI